MSEPRKSKRFSLSDFPLSLGLINDSIVISQPDFEIIDATLRISELKSAKELGNRILKMWSMVGRKISSGECPTIEKQPKAAPGGSPLGNFCTVAQAARFYGLSEATIKRMCADKSLKAKKVRGKWRITAEIAKPG